MFLNTSEMHTIYHQNQEFRQVEGASRYYVSQAGDVLSTFKGNHLVKAFDQGIGYMQLAIRMDNGKKRRFLIHRLVAIAFLPMQLDKSHVNHKDGNKRNNHVDNLEWCTRQENMQHAMRTGLRKVEHGLYLTPLGAFASARDAASALGTSVANVYRWCKAGKKRAQGWDFESAQQASTMALAA